MALPLLDAFGVGRTRAGSKGAEVVPRRLVCVNTPLGLHPAYFFPEKSGRDYELSPYLQVLKDFRDDFTVISGLSHPDVGPSHDSNLSFLTSAPHPERRAGFKNSISLDQFAAEHLYGQTRFPTLTLSCEGAGLSWTKSGAPSASSAPHACGCSRATGEALRGPATMWKTPENCSTRRGSGTLTARPVASSTCPVPAS
jgi:hypothetical protein